MTPKRPRDPNQLAKSVIDIATGRGLIVILRPTVWSCRQNVAIHPSLRQQLTIAGILQTDPLAPLDS